MTRTVKLRFQRSRCHAAGPDTQWTSREQTIEITLAWAGKGIAIHKPVSFDADDDQPYFRQVQGLWSLTHINSGLAMGNCHGNLDRAKSFARQWDAEFAALQAGETMAPDRIAAWKVVVDEMRTEPPRKPRQPVHRRGRAVAA
jgi:hypothetical protein